MTAASDKLIVALDVDSLGEAEKLVDLLYPAVKLFKVGSQLFTACGPDAVKMIYKKGASVFLDLKFYDIPNTVLSAVISGTGLACEQVVVSSEQSKIGEAIQKSIQPAVFMMTVHIKGGAEMLREAVKGAAKKAEDLKINRPFIVGVTRLTSDENTQDIKEEVIQSARLAKSSGLDGVVCSVLEARMMRAELGNDFLIVTPGIRPKGSQKNDQKRIATPKEAIRAGANYIVVGRPILEANDPVSVVNEILKELTAM